MFQAPYQHCRGDAWEPESGGWCLVDMVDAVMMTNVVGWVAGIASTASFAPQAWKIIKTRETKNISAWMYGLTVVAFVFWIVYGVLIGQWPVIVTNGICFGFAAFILMMKVLPRPGKDAVARSLDV